MRSFQNEHSLEWFVRLGKKWWTMWSINRRTTGSENIFNIVFVQWRNFWCHSYRLLQWCKCSDRFRFTLFQKPFFIYQIFYAFWWLNLWVIDNASYDGPSLMDRRYLEGSRETTSWEYMKGVPLLIVWIRRWYSNYLNLISSEAWIRPHSQSLLSVTVAHRLNTTLVFAREGHSILVQSQVKTKLSVGWSRIDPKSPNRFKAQYHIRKQANPIFRIKKISPVEPCWRWICRVTNEPIFRSTIKCV